MSQGKRISHQQKRGEEESVAGGEARAGGSEKKKRKGWRAQHSVPGPVMTDDRQIPNAMDSPRKSSYKQRSAKLKFTTVIAKRKWKNPQGDQVGGATRKIKRVRIPGGKPVQRNLKKLKSFGRKMAAYQLWVRTRLQSIETSKGYRGMQNRGSCTTESGQNQKGTWSPFNR